MNKVSQIQELIDKAVDCTSRNCMKINSKKTKEMIIRCKHDVQRASRSA